MSNAVQMGRAYVTVGLRLGQAYKDLRGFRQRLDRFAGEMQALSSRVAGLGMGISLPIAYATRTFAGFEDQMAVVRAVTGATGRDFDALTAKAEELGRTTSFTAKQVADGMTSLGRAGFKAGQILASIPHVLNLARATGTELGQAAEIAAATLRGFGLEAGESARVADVLTATANNSAQTLEELGESMKFVAPIAMEAGESLEDTAAALAVLANNGIKGSMAGTSLARAYKNLSASDAQKKLREIGVEAVDASGDLRHMADILEDLAQQTKGMGSAGKLDIFETLFGRGQAAALKLAREGMRGGFDEIKRVLDNARGTAERTAKQMDDTLAGSFRMLLSAVEGVQIAIGNAVKGPIHEWVDKARDAAEGASKWIAANGDMVRGLSGLGAAALAAAGALGGIALGAKGISLLLAGGSGLISLTGGAAKAFRALNHVLIVARVTDYHSALSMLVELVKKIPGIFAASEGAIGAMQIAFTAAGGGWAGLINAIRVAIPIIASAAYPWIALGLAIVGVGAAAYKAWKYFSDLSAIESTRREIERLHEATKKANDEIERLDRLNKRGKYFTREAAASEVEREIQRLKELGKTDAQIRAHMEENVRSLEKWRGAVWSVETDENERKRISALSPEAFAGQKKENLLLLEQYKVMLEEGRIAKVKTESEKLDAVRQSAAEELRAEKELAEKLKSIQDDLTSYRVMASRRQADAAANRAFREAVERNPVAAAEQYGGEERAARSRLDAARMQTDRMQRMSAAYPTDANIEELGEAVEAEKRLADAWDQSADRARQANEEVMRANQARVDSVRGMMRQITDAMHDNPLISGDQSVFGNLVPAAQEAVKRIRRELWDLSIDADGMTADAFRKTQESLRQQLSDALEARRPSVERAPSWVTRGSFSAREIAGWGSGGGADNTQKNMLTGVKKIVEVLERIEKKDSSALYG